MELLGSRYYYSLLDDKDKVIYDEIYKAILARKTSVSFKGIRLDNENYSSIIIAINYDNPQFFYMNFNECRWVTALFITSIKLTYYYNSSKIIELNKEIINIVSDILHTEINNYQSDYDKVLRLYNKLKFMSIYDNEAAEMILSQKVSSKEANTIVGMFLKNKCVCEGYGKAMQLLCTMVGVESVVVRGTAQSNVARGSHCWNLVKINGYYHHVDVTWDSQHSDGMRGACYGYFNLSDSSIEKDHIWDRNRYPKCREEPYNYFKMNSSLISSKVELEKLLYENFMNEEEHICFKIKETNSFKDPGVHAMEGIIFTVSAKCKYSEVKRYEMTFIESQKVYAVHIFY